MKIKVLIIDDEPQAIEVIANYIRNFPELELVEKCDNAVRAFQILQSTPVDLLFLDIKMPGLLGTDLVKTLKRPPRIIFTTAYQNFALEAFELNALDYLLKPISFDRFLKAMEKVLDYYKLKQNTGLTLKAEPVQTPTESVLYLRVERKMVKVRVSDIYWIESAKDYIKVFLKDRVLISKQKISTLEELLPENQFIRIHRSFMVACDKIESYHSYCIEILGKQLPIGRNYKLESQKKLRELFGNFS
ncbi:DNA-binding response regulator [Pelobium manganitolerans]|uniref:DNA-binding response regulator n=1 Tax=Pelobium manganitolerans TaxID=1842495 RepID=A0A419S8A5_9SPHI|nr:LytTR family DNA-binding domain-containing protein [Pelobium manganitolerans]RKD17995.1 DNA-binding response regulator [Pelobium manganitolerans]